MEFAIRLTAILQVLAEEVVAFSVGLWATDDSLGFTFILKKWAGVEILIGQKKLMNTKDSIS
ncbi:MAG: hypothetical protein D3926_02165 [Desulfobacteraceae bacterium]|nr:MAG: hypothetical protein D3926_02165 [Desulfobacteraceae bacterium]